MDAEDWREHRKRRKAKRASNREYGPVLLRQHGIQFESHNGGAHLVVCHEGRTADYWPGTGKWRIRGKERSRRGVFGLLRALEVES